MATIYIDNKPYVVKDGQNLLHACLSLGFDLPYFCWHPAMHSVGACRQCAVKQFRDEKDTKGKIVMSCMTPAAEGTRISIDDPEAMEFRASVIEWLMLSHPHDCPVCDEGGECHLQDMTVMTGHNYRRTRFPKRTHRNQDLGPFINHEMNRCIQCYRCVRFYCDYAQGRDFNVFACHHAVYFGRHRDGVLESEFSGNLIEICPTGVFTDKALKRHYTRKWDLQTAPSVCVHCGLGCNTIPGERYGALRRILNRYNGEVNGYFLCDRGRFGYEFVNSGQRVRTPLMKNNETGALEPATKGDVIERLSHILYFGANVIGIGSARASLEANFALRALVGPDRFFVFDETRRRLMATMIGILKSGPARTPSMKDVASSDAVFILGEDVANTAPMLALALRQAARQRPMQDVAKLKIPLWDDTAVREVIQGEKGPFFIAAPHATKLDDVATETYHAAGEDIARLGFAVAHELDPAAPPVPDLKEEALLLARRIALFLKGARRPLVVSGMSGTSDSLLRAAGNVAWALCKTGHDAALCFTTDECNSLGLGLLADLGDGYVSDIGKAFALAEKGKLDAIIILENDLFLREDISRVERFLEGCGHVIVIDHLFSRTTGKADIVLPAGTFAESDGTFVNNEGRAQRCFQVFVPEGDIQESWRWVRDALNAARRPIQWRTFDDVVAAMAGEMQQFEAVAEIAPPAGFRIAGQKIPRQPHRYSGRTAMHAQIDVHEPKPPDDADTPLAYSMEGFEGIPPSALVPRFWAPGWNSVQSVNKFQEEVGGPLRGDDPGKRLIEPTGGKEVPYFHEVPGAFVPRKGELLIVPLYHIFGSEELSVLSPGIAGMAPHPYLALNPFDAEGLGMNAGDEGEVVISGNTYRLPITLMASLPQGVAGLPSGLPGLRGIVFPAWAKTGRAT
ncbi:MAG: NADH-quinone oxidoreductase subunit NuoG [Nitrospirae bacterium]|nr:NADH-quinone oxidoreductase subunit NuoG [Nitrospirota bacterium]